MAENRKTDNSIIFEAEDGTEVEFSVVEQTTLGGVNYLFVIDWDTLLRLSERKGRFICEEKELLFYRVHDGAETKKNIKDHNREHEERMIFSKLWPRPVVALLMHFYKKAYKDYDTDTD